MSEMLPWHVARASGIVAWLLVTAAVVWGLGVSTRITSKRPPRGWWLDLHRFLGGLATTFTVVHVVALVADSYVSFGPLDLLVPLASDWRPVPVAFGVVGLWLVVAIQVTSLLMKRLPRRVWVAVHRSSFGLYVVATAHLLGAGSDVRNPLLGAAVVASVAAVGFLTALRLLHRRPARPARAARPAHAERPSRNAAQPDSA